MTPLLYNELAAWWPLFSDPEDYAEEAALYAKTIHESSRRPVRSVLELGSGGGNTASHMKTHFEMTLADLSPQMLDVSRQLNPECEHVQGDMRTLRLGRTFDAVFVQDAVMYMTTEDDLRAVVGTAAEHLAPGGVALFAPDDTAETYRDDTDHGGHDGDGRAIRYLEWTRRRDERHIDVTFVYVLRDGEQLHVEHEQHTFGLFDRETWLQLIAEGGLEAQRLPYTHTDFETDHNMFVGIKSV